MKRVLAVAVASLLVALGIVIRGALDDDDGDDGRGDDGPTAELVVACVQELAAACEALDAAVTIEDPDDTIAAAGDYDAWVTFDPWPEIADVSDDETRFLGERIAVASSDLVVLFRVPSVPDECDGEATFACLVDAGSRVHAPSQRRALGPLVLAFAGVGFFGRPFATNDLREDAPEQLDLQARLRRVRVDVADPVSDMLLPLGGAGPQATGTTEADVDARVRTSVRGDDLDVLADPPATVVVVVAGPAADRVAGSDALRDGLAALGWDVDVEPDATTTGLPNAGVLFALQELS